ncbi:hypothetical protein KEC48_03825 [Clostridium sp. C1]|uniref:hypothetical protein n=1 Tax=Clostridium sp. C1 TaxID=1155388 RepID=UPI001BA4FFA8|nr:hypothetical protein [Clostridium sp. C1]QUN13668.1 hypothetical protein KEC48_03825 [Clostridium sp. C1]
MNEIIERLRRLSKSLKEMKCIDHIEQLDKDIDEIEKIFDKTTPKRAIIISNDKNILIFDCPKCGKRTHTNFQRNYCGECGQKLDWSDEE